MLYWSDGDLEAASDSLRKAIEIAEQQHNPADTRTVLIPTDDEREEYSTKTVGEVMAKNARVSSSLLVS